MGTVLTLAAYAVAAFFFWRVIWRLQLWLTAAPEARPASSSQWPMLLGLAIMDVLFLRRLFIVNRGLWVGEWLFHVSFVLVAIRHMRYFIEPVPALIAYMQPLGVVAGYVLPGALLYIFVYRFLIERGKYFSRYNLVLTVMLFLTGATGLLMKGYLRIDLVEVKAFILKTLTFSLGSGAPDGLIFLFHWTLALAFFSALPSHIMIAPQMLFEARRRELETEEIMHDG